jgi:spore coat polysaccharide biosynthesis protein SpsF (cytidylyltransferase family)
MMEIEGSPMLSHIIRRVNRAAAVCYTIVATTELAEDDIVATTAAQCGAYVVRGSVDDVLSRYVDAQLAYSIDVVVRITADCPLLDSRLIDRCVRALRKQHADYSSNVIVPTYPDGYDVEVLTGECLARVSSEATRAYEREHVTSVIREIPDRYRVATVTCRRDLSGMRLTVDHEDDLERVRSIYSEMRPRVDFGLGAILRLLGYRPELAGMDDGHRRDERYLTQRAKHSEDVV